MTSLTIVSVIFSCMLIISNCYAEDVIDDKTFGLLTAQFNTKVQLEELTDKKPYAPEIIGGKEAAKGEFPWQVSFQYVENGMHFCGGSIIDKSWILTAAHCTENLQGDFVIVAGKHNLTEKEGTEQQRIPDIIHKHELYDKEGNDENDIAIIKLDKPLKLNDRVNVVALPSEETEPSTMCTVSGWGARSDSIFDPDMPDTLHKVNVPIVTDKVCEAGCENLRCVIEETMLCAGYEEGGKDTCQGDSGGPMVCLDSEGKITQVGVVSVGYGCALPGLYGVYTEVRYYRDWINAKQQNRIIGNLPPFPSGVNGTLPPFPSGANRNTVLSFSAVFLAILKLFLF